jgi:hypothetical protein
MILDKATILAAHDRKRVTVPVPEWGDGAEVIIQEMSALDRDRLSAEVRTGDAVDSVNFAARTLVRCLVNAAGERLFSDEDAPALGEKAASVVERLFKRTQELNKLASDAEKEAGNSEPSRSADLPSG